MKTMKISRMFYFEASSPHRCQVKVLGSKPAIKSIKVCVLGMTENCTNLRGVEPSRCEDLSRKQLAIKLNSHPQAGVNICEKATPINQPTLNRMSNLSENSSLCFKQ